MSDQGSGSGSVANLFHQDPIGWIREVAYTFGAAEVIFLVIASIQLRRLQLSADGSKWRIRELFHVAVIMLSLARVTFFFLAYELEYGAVSQNNRLSGVVFASLNFLGDTLFYLLYSPSADILD